MKKFFVTLTTFLATLMLVACQNNASTSDNTELSSMPKITGFSYQGDIPKNPKKVVNFAYSYTGYLLELGVNVSSYSLDLEKNSPAFGNELADAVKLTSDDTEAIAAQEPDLIIAFSTDEHLKELKDIAPVLVIEYGKNDYLAPNISDMDSKTNAFLIMPRNWDEEAMLQMVAGQKSAAIEAMNTDKAKEELAPYLDASTSFTVMDFYDKAIYLYGNNWGRGGELIYDSLGFSAPETVKKDVFSSGWFVISQEVLADYVGDYLVLNVSKDTKDAAASLKESDVWKNIPAVKNQKVLEVDENLFYFSDPMSLDKQLETFTAAIKKANS